MGLEHAIVAENLCKRYGEAPALSGFDLRVAQGTVHGLLGPNGAGKTTAVRILSTLTRLDGGRAEVAGFDVVRQSAEVRTRIGLLGQYAAVDEVLSGRQNLVMFGRLYHLGKRAAQERAEELLEQFALTDTGTKPVKDYSGGMRRRLDLAASLIVAPQVLFLDEPTTGLDPRSRNEVWAAVRSLVDDGTTVLLTTQYLDEADQLADRISVIASRGGTGGRVIAEGTPDELKSTIGGDRIDITVRDAADFAVATRVLARVTGREPDTDAENWRLGVPVQDRVVALTETVRALGEAGVVAEDIALRRPPLDEVFLHLTGPDKDTGKDVGTEAAGTVRDEKKEEVSV
ncbi:ATP-binding cassette domain-containing protein [Streptomyces sp. WAC05374]|uniref:ATP-binding cassette domain-containing protein n=1 Tax=Streptomyces sp. WAC05374 TaxID=2487420 RepID=UPI000F891976|nr:ATP-binding cassette domain-containing protein [Streptomyces sp. WAC05374]RST16644.1 ATP-binding cassette domain-containing protein [Streptomyces sp. WAC05374]TDF35971.1 ATP-binding cassette domain-containing protein [Streptomyces sp. WAC05374]TDF44534.1 ATP-binding cassette domain-containing protein [Streptomyces sp. WAC05374]